MSRNDYLVQIQNDIRNAFDWGDYTDDMPYDELYEKMWIDDSITGNASGSYYCNAYRAEEMICHNMDLAAEALAEFGYTDISVDRLDSAEWLDVTIRCYLLSEALGTICDERGIHVD